MSFKLFLVMVVTVGSLAGTVTMSSSSSRVSRHKRSDDEGPLETVVEHLSQQVTSLNAQLNSANSRIATLETKTGWLVSQLVS